MSFLQSMKLEMERKRKQIADVEVEVDGKKFFKRADLTAKIEQAYIDKLKQKRGLTDEIEDNVTEGESSRHESDEHRNSVTRAVDDKVPMTEVRRKLRLRAQPILLFGENDNDVRERLLKLEIEQPDMKEGWKNEMQAAMQDVDDDIVKEVLEGSSNDCTKHDVDLPDSYDESWEKIEQQATLLGLGDDAGRDCDIILSFFKIILAKWGKVLNQRDEQIKKSAQGKHEASIHKQTATNLKPLMNSLESHTCNNDIRHHLVKIARLLILDRNYILANNAYMEMAIGNSPWPVGVTRSGIHQRPGSAKAYVSNIAHVLNDETQRKYIQSFKRLMTRMQEYYPTDPSKCVEFVKPANPL